MLGVFYTATLLLTLFYSTLSSPYERSITMVNTAAIDQVDTVIPDPFTVDHCTYESDIILHQDEFSYLMGIGSGSYVSAQDIKRGLFYLFKKNKFESITLLRTNNRLHLQLTSFWTLEKITIHGIWYGSDEYKSLYLMEPGERFDQERHEHSVARIKEFCAQQGYGNVIVKSRFDYDHRTKAIAVHLTITLGSKTTIGRSVVHVESNELTPEERAVVVRDLEKKVQRLNGRIINKDLLDTYTSKLERDLLEKGYYHSTIQVERVADDNNVVSLVWSVYVNQKRAFAFVGNRFFSTTQLFNWIMAFGRSATVLPSSLIVQELIKRYKDQGFWQVKVCAEQDGEQIYFRIDEGTRATIRGVTLHNVTFYAPRYVVKKCCGPIKHHPHAEKKQIELVLERLIAWYVRRGFLDAKIGSHTFELIDEAQQQYHLHISMEEGERCFVTKIAIPGFEELIARGPFIAGDSILFTTTLLQRQHQWLQEYFRSLGYLHPTVRSECTRAGKGIAIVWHVVPGNKTITGKTVITGSSRIPFATINREACYHQGDVWNRDNLRKTFKRLKETEIFEAIQLAPATDTWGVGERPVLITIQKDEPFELRLRGGLELEQIQQWQTFLGVSYRVGGSFIVKSPFDQADQLRIDGDFASKHREVVAKYQSPWFWHVPVKTTIQLYSVKHDQAFLGIKKDVYNVYQNGGLVGLFKKIARVDCGLTVGFEWMKTSINSSEAKTRIEAFEIANALNFEPALLNRQIPFVFVEQSVIMNYLDSKVYPTSGWFSLISLKGMFPVVREQFDSYFVRLLVEQKLFFPLKALITILRIRFGHIFHQDFRAIMPNERFYLGGVHSLRSYDTDLAPPLGCFIDSNGNDHVVPQGGKSMVNANVELRFSLFEKGGLILFQDVGFLSSNTFADFETKKVLAGTGFGAWYKTPVGPIRFDIGWKWSTIDQFERPYAWFLTLGQSF